MSTIQLTDELLSNIQGVLEEHDEQTRDAGIGIQYLAAILGFLVARFPTQTGEQKQQILRELFDFASHVLDQNTRQEPPAAGPEEAFGIWKPNGGS